MENGIRLINLRQIRETLEREALNSVFHAFRGLNWKGKKEKKAAAATFMTS